jgi:hypothetical protein
MSGSGNGDGVTGVEIALRSTQSDAEEALGAQIAAEISSAGPTGLATADFSRSDPTCPTESKANWSEVSSFQKPSNRNFLIVVCDLEEDIAKSRIKASTIHPKSLNPNKKHDQHTMHRGERTQAKLSHDPIKPQARYEHTMMQRRTKDRLCKQINDEP